MENKNMVFDLSDEQIGGLGFEVMPKGEYNVEVTELDWKESQAGNMMIAAVYEVCDCEDDEAQYNGRKLFDYFSFSDKALDITKKKLKAMISNWYPDYDMSSFDPEEFAKDPDNLGIKGRVKLGVRPAKGDYEASNNVKDYLVPSEGENIW